MSACRAPVCLTLDISELLKTEVFRSSLNVIPQWKFPFLRGDHPLTSENNLTLKLDASLSPIWAGLTGDVILTAAPFLSFRLGAMTGTGWNYDLAGAIPLTGLGMNRLVPKLG
jgi:hypothetical protein